MIEENIEIENYFDIYEEGSVKQHNSDIFKTALRSLEESIKRLNKSVIKSDKTVLSSVPNLKYKFGGDKIPPLSKLSEDESSSVDSS